MLKERGLEPFGEPMFAYYDPLWTPGPLRRNEITQGEGGSEAIGSPFPGFTQISRTKIET